MIESDLSSEESSRRTLAAIVFTDIADFSALMGANEDRTLALVKRDLALIRELCDRFRGRVLKSTGDGVLMYFDSAVQAVACAQHIQKAITEQAAKLPPEQTLKHRIGIHLGDVFVSESDVMGDGVNVAARLQAEAEPGGICISQTVYDVVKNRLGVQATYLGPRELKNIRDAVPVYKILLAAQSAGTVAVGRHRLLWWQWVIIGTLAAVLMLAVVLSLIVVKGVDMASGTVGASSQPAAEASRNLAAPSVVAGEALPAASSMPVLAADEKYLAQRQLCLSRNDFSGMAHWLEKNDRKDAPAYERYSKLGRLRPRVQAALMLTSKDEPLVIELAAGAPQLEIFDMDGTMVLKRPEGMRDVQWSELDPATMVGLVRAILRKSPSGSKQATELSEAMEILLQEYREAGLFREGGQ